MTLPNRFGHTHGKVRYRGSVTGHYAFSRGDYSYQVWNDGSRIARLAWPGDSEYIIERVALPDHSRVKWHIVDREECDADDMHPRAIAGPFDTLKAAKVALKVLEAGHATRT